MEEPAHLVIFQRTHSKYRHHYYHALPDLAYISVAMVIHNVFVLNDLFVVNTTMSGYYKCIRLRLDLTSLRDGAETTSRPCLCGEHRAINWTTNQRQIGGSVLAALAGYMN